MSSDAFTIPGRIELLLRNPELRAAPLRSCYCWLDCNLGCWGMGHDAPLNREARWTIRLYVSPDDDALTGFELHFPNFDELGKFLETGEADAALREDVEIAAAQGREAKSAQAGEGGRV